ncbi:hypothetical protein Tco_0115040 [Tanacetum coccineum]
MHTPLALVFHALSNPTGCDRDEFGLDSNDDDDVVPKVEEVPLVDGVLEDAFGGKCDEDFVVGEDVLVSSSSLVKYTKSYVQGGFLGGLIASFSFFDGFDEKAWMDAMDGLRIEGKEEDDDEE